MLYMVRTVVCVVLLAMIDLYQSDGILIHETVIEIIITTLILKLRLVNYICYSFVNLLALSL